MVGGLPDSKVNHPLDYVVTWSVDGLINEYKDDCQILEDGELKIVKGMSGLEAVECDTLGKLEAFYTSGGASHSIFSMRDRGVQNCSYKSQIWVQSRWFVCWETFLLDTCTSSTLENILYRFRTDLAFTQNAVHI